MSSNVKRKNCSYKCWVPGCSNTRHSNKLCSFFLLPDNEVRRSLWLRLIKRLDLINKQSSSGVTICEEHFEKKDVVHHRRRKQLAKDALPSLNLPTHENINILTHDGPHLTSEQFEMYSDTLWSKKTQTPSDSVQFENIADDKTELQEVGDKILPQELRQLVQIKLNNLKAVTDLRAFCLDLYFVSPQIYSLLCKGFGLPRLNILYKYYIPVSTEINDSIMKTLKAKVERMTNVEKECSLMIGKMSLTPRLSYNIKEDKIIGLQDIDGVQSLVCAENAIVVMVRGIFCNWKQPIAYALISDDYDISEIARWIEKKLDILFQIGLNIRTIVSDLEDVCMKTVNYFSLSPDKAYIFVNGRKMYYIIDAISLIKAVKHCLSLYDFHFDNYVAKYEYIEKFFQADQNRTYRLAPKLTQEHIIRPSTNENSFSHATQVLSRTVGVGLSKYIDVKAIDEGGRGTVELIIRINDLFDILNSSNKQTTGCEYKRVFSGTQNQILFLQKKFEVFQNLKIIDPQTGQNVTSRVTFIQALLRSMQSILLLLNDIKADGYNSIMTRRLNKETLNTFFKQVKETVPETNKLTSLQFQLAFKKLFFVYIRKQITNNEPQSDLIKFISRAAELLSDCEQKKRYNIENTNSTILQSLLEEDETKMKNAVADVEIRVKCSDYNQINLKGKSLLYICDYLLMKCKEKHDDCLIFETYLKTDGTISDTTSLSTSSATPDRTYLRCKQHRFTNLGELLHCTPCDSFVVFVEEMQIIFNKTFQRKKIHSSLSELLYKEMKYISFSPPCPCFPEKYLIMLYIRMRIFCTIKFNNKNLKSNTNNKIFTVQNLS